MKKCWNIPYLSLRRGWSWILGDFLRESVFWVERDTKEEKWICLKICHCLALKTVDSRISWVCFSWSYLRNCHWSVLTVFAVSSYLRASRETLYLKFSVFWNLPPSFSREGLSRDLLAKMPLEKFFDKE